MYGIAPQTRGERRGQPQDLRGRFRKGQGVLRRSEGEYKVRSRRVRRSGLLKGKDCQVMQLKLDEEIY